MPIRLSKIDELTRQDHTFLSPDDECYYLGDYTARRGSAFSEMNNLIINLRKPVERRGRPEWRYKENAITRFGQMFHEALNERFLTRATLVPMPPSHMREDPAYDDRMPRILQEVGRGTQADIRELLVMSRNVTQSHLAAERVSIPELVNCMAIDEALAEPPPEFIGLFDDVLTTGRHFKAAQEILARRFPGPLPTRRLAGEQVVLSLRERSFVAHNTPFPGVPVYGRRRQGHSRFAVRRWRNLDRTGRLGAARGTSGFEICNHKPLHSGTLEGSKCAKP